MITQERLKDVLNYDSESGIFTWKKKTNRNILIGSVAGAGHSGGYITISIDGKRYYAHRLAWLYVYGTWPDSQIDHVDNNKINNKISNLRDVCAGLNSQNKIRCQRNNSTGMLGVARCSNSNKFAAYICTNGSKKYLGIFETKELAHQAYLKAKR